MIFFDIQSTDESLKKRIYFTNADALNPLEYYEKEAGKYALKIKDLEIPALFTTKADFYACFCELIENCLLNYVGHKHRQIIFSICLESETKEVVGFSGEVIESKVGYGQKRIILAGHNLESADKGKRISDSLAHCLKYNNT